MNATQPVHSTEYKRDLYKLEWSGTCSQHFSFRFLMLRASCLTWEMNEFRYYEAKIEGSEKASRLSCLSGRTLAAQARGVLGLTPGSTPSNCRPFHFPLFRLIASKFTNFAFRFLSIVSL